MNIFLLGATPSFPAEVDEDPISRLAKTGGNTGNQLIARGLLDRIVYDDLSWDHRIDPRAVHERFDMIVVAAANFLFPKFDLGGMAQYIERADLPVAIVGLGAQSSNYDPNISLMPGTERFVKVIAERAVSIGVRGPYTQEVLALRGVHNVTVTGCPSYYMGGPHGMNIPRRPFEEIKRLSINASRDVIVHSFDQERMLRLVREIYSTGITWKADFVAQSEQAEIRLGDKQARNAEESLNELSTFLAGVAPEADIRRWATNHVRVFFDVDNWLDTVQTYDFVFGNRFHGCMIALQRGVPALVICHDTRTEDMCRFLGMPFVSIVDLDEIDVAQLYGRVGLGSLARRYQGLYPAYMRFLAANKLIAKS
ncbi:polysaccharide pyruvyl transferase family protein [Bradyrhizobium hipponense]|uniref:Polysaccharide pyruvyl transferase family protein n=1 Tax=Bradyrhizobium hipponense TaxID=2605638 RepID=A0A5S4YCB6_9BRAD|nr:polysaccharide pyruvyl transferase family protein [Bradyrhizobium hipponense]TYO62061.1 polysaccharide pyruvyl transferase family protein [Bradyrhizobium hipponense]